MAIKQVLLLPLFITLVAMITVALPVGDIEEEGAASAPYNVYYVPSETLNGNKDGFIRRRKALGPGLDTMDVIFSIFERPDNSHWRRRLQESGRRR